MEVSNEDYVYNSIPRGVVTPGGVNLLIDQLTSPYTRGTLQLEYEGNLSEFTAEFRRMPLTMSVTIKYYLDSFTDSLEVLQYIITHLNFIRTYQIIYMGQSIICSYKFPDDLEEEFNAEFDGLTQDAKFKTVEVQLEVETNLPVYYPRTAIEADLTISGEYLWEVGDEVFEDEDAAFDYAKEHNLSMKRISKMLWNKEPIFDNGKLVKIEDKTDERLSGTKEIKK
jgi:hypothetical protein